MASSSRFCLNTCNQIYLSELNLRHCCVHTSIDSLLVSYYKSVTGLLPAQNRHFWCLIGQLLSKLNLTTTNYYFELRDQGYRMCYDRWIYLILHYICFRKDYFHWKCWIVQNDFTLIWYCERYHDTSQSEWIIRYCYQKLKNIHQKLILEIQS